LNILDFIITERLPSLAGPGCPSKQRAAIPGQVYGFVRRFLADKTVAGRGVTI